MKKSKAAKANSDAGPKQPVTNTDREERIRQRAYQLWEQSGCVHGRDMEHWLHASEEIARRDSECHFPD